MRLLTERFNGETLTVDGVLEATVMREPADLPAGAQGTCTWVSTSVFTDGELLLESGTTEDGK